MKTITEEMPHATSQQPTTPVPKQAGIHNKTQQLATISNKSRPSFRTRAAREKSPEPMQVVKPERHSYTTESQEISPYSQNDEHFSATTGNNSQQNTTTPPCIISSRNPIKMKTITAEMPHTTPQQPATIHNKTQQF